MKVLLKAAQMTRSIRGCPTDDQRSLVESVLYACFITPEKVQLNVPSNISICRQLGIPMSTGKRILKLVGKKRKEVRHGVFISSWSQVKSRAGFWKKVDQELRTKIDA